MPSPDKVGLLVGNRVHDDWESYEIDSDLMTPSDAWRVSYGLRKGELPPTVKPGEPVQVKVGADTVLVGRIDEVALNVTKREHSLSMSGRDGAAVLVDCSAPIFVTKQATLLDIMNKVVKPLGITKIKLDAANARTREKVNVEPGDTAWDTLTHAAEANGLWPWFTPDGTLIIGGPDYASAPVATLIMRRSGQGNNVLSLNKCESVAERFSEITVLGQTHGTATETGKHALKAGAKDSGVSWYRPKIVIDHESDSLAVCRDRARKLVADARLSGFTLIATVFGHRTSDGVLWTPGQRINVESEPHAIDGVFYLMARKFTLDRSSGTVTELTLKEDKTWLLDAHPHKRKHRRGKNDQPGEIIDVSGATS